METSDLAFGRRVIWKGQVARIVDIVWRVDRTSVQIQCRGYRPVWVRPVDIEPEPVAQAQRNDG